MKFLGIYSLQPNLTGTGIGKQYYLRQRIKGLTFLKIVVKNPWGQDIKTLIHLALFCRIETNLSSKGVFISAPKSYLKTLQSLDSKAVPLEYQYMRLPWGHKYREAGILPLDEVRKLAEAKYILRGSSVANNTNTVAELRYV